MTRRLGFGEMPRLRPPRSWASAAMHRSHSMPLHRKYWPRCGARTRQGRPCRMAVVELGKRRCKFHGGLSTGPKVDRARIAAMERILPKYEPMTRARIGPKTPDELSCLPHPPGAANAPRRDHAAIAAHRTRPLVRASLMVSLRARTPGLSTARPARSRAR